MDDLDKEIERLNKKIAARKTPEDIEHETLDKEIARLQRKKTVNIAAAPTEVVDEMHPDFSAADRLIVKNFSNDPEEAKNYLSRKHPNLEIENRDGNFIARAKGSSDPYKVLDPSFSPLQNPLGTAKDALFDLGDVAGDIAMGGLSGLATAGGAIAGGLATGGLGALPAAAAAGAGSSAGLEALRQEVGKYLGVNSEVKTGDVIGAGAGGAISPLLFGAGSAVKPALASGTSAARQGIANVAESGLLGTGWDKVAAPALRQVGSWASGATPESLKVLSKRAGEFWPAANDPEIARDMLKTNISKIDDAFHAKEQEAIAPYINELSKKEAAGVQVSMEPLNEAVERKIASTKEMIKKGGNAKGDSANELLGMLEDFQSNYLMGSGTREVRTPRTFDTGKLDPFTMKPIMETVEDVSIVPTTSAITAKSPLAAQKLEQDLYDIVGATRSKAGKETTDLTNLSPAEKDFERFGKELKGMLSANMSDLVGPEARASNAAFGKLRELRKEADPLIKTPEAFFRNTKNAGVSTNIPKKGLMKVVDKKLEGTGAPKLLDEIEFNNALETFAPDYRQSFFASTLRPRSIPAGAAGAAAGLYMSSRDGEGGYGGAIAGGLLGAALGNPVAMQKYISGSLRASGAKDAVLKRAPFVPNALGSQVMGNWLSLEP